MSKSIIDKFTKEQEREIMDGMKSRITAPAAGDSSEVPVDLIAYKWVETLSAGAQNGLTGGDVKRLSKMIAQAIDNARPVVGHPEDYCHRCNGPNITWFAPSSLWNQVVRAGDHPEILCPVCFVELAELSGIKPTAWRVAPESHKNGD